MFGNKSSNIKEPSLLTIEQLTEQEDLDNTLRLLPKFNLQHIPDGFIYKDSLILKEKVIADEDKVAHRTDYIITPKRGVKRLSGNRLAVDSSLSRRFDDLLAYLNDTGNTRMPIFGDADIKRFLTEDGSEIYTYNGIEVLEVKADVCKKCKVCNETAPTVWGTDKAVVYNEHNLRTINDIREFKINPPFLGLFFGAGIHIAELTHPCQYRTLHDILKPKYKTADPPEIKIVFPKQKD